MDPTIVLIAALVAVQPKEEHAVARKETQTIASDSFETFKRMVTKDNYRQMGFQTSEEIKEAVLGEPILDYMVRLDELRAYETGRDPSALLHSTNHVVYPVLVNAQTRSSFTLAKTESGWTPVSYGSPVLTRSLTKTRASSSLKTKLPESDYFRLRIPALNLYFVGYQTGGPLMLIPVFDDSRFAYEAEVALPANDVFLRLQPAAKTHNGLPQ
jgi:hypothetical protein